MFINNPIKSFSFTKILSGISKTLNVANQLIPIYNQAKPMINNSKKILTVLKEFKPKNNNKEDDIKITIEPKKIEPKLNGPIFFS